MTATDVLLEVNGSKNENYQFLPAAIKLRGRFDPLRMADPGPLRQRFPKPIPGQRIGLDAKTRTGFIVEPLHDDDNAPIREVIERDYKLPEAVRTVENIDVATWAAWLRWGVESGILHVVEGKLPAVNGEPQTRFIGRTQPDPMNRLADAMEEQNALMRQLLKRVIEK